MNTETQRRLRRYLATDTFIVDMLKTGWTADRVECTEGVPPDAEFIGAFYELSTLCVYFVFSHPSFGVVLPGAIIPEGRPPLYKKTYAEPQ